jgi:hypothetical protein
MKVIRQGIEDLEKKQRPIVVMRLPGMDEDGAM